MDVKNCKKIITPFLMGQRRDGLCRINEMDGGSWDIVDATELQRTELRDSDEKIRNMGILYSLLSEKVRHAVMSGFVPISIAGDCVSALGVLAGLQKAGRQPDRILWLDAHGDFHTWETTQTQYIGGMPLAMIVGHGDQRIAEMVGLQSYPENRIILSDARDLDPMERDALENSTVVRCHTNNVLEHFTKDQSIYLHWDTDVLSAEQEMPALKYHVKHGPTYQQMKKLFKSLASKHIIAISVSAWHEEKDTGNTTARACLDLLKNLYG